MKQRLSTLSLAVALSWSLSSYCANAQQTTNTLPLDTTNAELGSKPNSSEPNFSPLKAGQRDRAYESYVIGDYEQAFKLASTRASKGDATAQTLLGRLYLEGIVVAQDGARAALWFKRAADQGDPQAQLRYGLFLYNGTYVNQDMQKGQELVRKAAEAGIPEAYNYYGQMLLGDGSNDRRRDLALSWFLKGVAKGDADSAYAASQILAKGTTSLPIDEVGSRKLLELASNKDLPSAQIDLAIWLMQGRGGETDFKRAFDLLLLNAHRGIVLAQLNLARFYRDGYAEKGGVIDAAAWYMAAYQEQAKTMTIQLENKQKLEKEQNIESDLKDLTPQQIQEKANRMAKERDLEDMLQSLSAEQLQEAKQMSTYFIPSLFPPVQKTQSKTQDKQKNELTTNPKPTEKQKTKKTSKPKK